MTDTPDRREPAPSTRRTENVADTHSGDAPRDVDSSSPTVTYDSTDDYAGRRAADHHAEDHPAHTDAAHTDRRDAAVAPAGALAPRDVAARERERFGGMKFGSAFFGWLAALGFVALLSAVVAAIGGALGFTSPQTAEDAATAATDNPLVTTIVGAVVIGIVLFVGYFVGGYVAGRMARFSGLMQGLGVWLWAIIFAVVVAIITAIVGTQSDLLGALDGFPRIPVSADATTVTGILTAIGAAIVTLAGALLGGVAGMRYHRAVDRVGLGVTD